jgi:hypothetical protein
MDCLSPYDTNRRVSRDYVTHRLESRYCARRMSCHFLLCIKLWYLLFYSFLWVRGKLYTWYIHLYGNIFDILLELIGKLADWRVGRRVLARVGSSSSRRRRAFTLVTWRRFDPHDCTMVGREHNAIDNSSSTHTHTHAQVLRRWYDYLVSLPPNSFGDGLLVCFSPIECRRLGYLLEFK